MIKYSLSAGDSFPAKTPAEAKAAVHRDAKVKAILELHIKPQDALSMIRGVYA